MTRRGSLLAQFPDNPIAPIAATAAGVNRGSLRIQNSVGNTALAGRTLSPLTISRARCGQDPAHPGDGKLVAMFLDPGVLHRDPFAKYAAA
jgi:hypothetical protein